MCFHLVPGTVALLGNVLTFGLLRHATRESAMQFVFILAMMFLGIATAQGRSLTDRPAPPLDGSGLGKPDRHRRRGA
jgi:hypothetical protein